MAPADAGVEGPIRLYGRPGWKDVLGEGEDEPAGESARFTREGGMRARPGVHRIPVGAGDGGVKAVGKEPTLESRLSKDGLSDDGNLDGACGIPDKGTAGAELGMGGFAESVEAVREIASEPGPIAGNRARTIK